MRKKETAGEAVKKYIAGGGGEPAYCRNLCARIGGCCGSWGRRLRVCG